jgi:CheY-like chemotaxis protein
MPQNDLAAKLRVLIVEDNEINQLVLAKRLRMGGHIVITSADGQEGLDIVKTDKDFDCILMDINMPILNGFEATQKIREAEATFVVTPGTEQRVSQVLNGRIPIFAVSASLLEEQREKLSDCGMDGWYFCSHLSSCLQY